jgi:hypothetical protein
MVKLLPCALLALFLSLSCTPSSAPGSDPDAGLTPIAAIENAFRDRQSDLQVMQQGTLTRILADDTSGDRHQRMIVRLRNDQTLLIAHNIDLAPRVPDPVAGKPIRFHGEYEWNAEGGVVHWTHRDPAGAHPDGWLEYEGRRYE